MQSCRQSTGIDTLPPPIQPIQAMQGTTIRTYPNFLLLKARTAGHDITAMGATASTANMQPAGRTESPVAPPQEAPDKQPLEYKDGMESGKVKVIRLASLSSSGAVKVESVDTEIDDETFRDVGICSYTWGFERTSSYILNIHIRQANESKCMRRKNNGY